MGKGAGAGVCVGGLEVGLVGFEDGEVLGEGVEFSGFLGADGALEGGGEALELRGLFGFFVGGIFPLDEKGAGLGGGGWAAEGELEGTVNDLGAVAFFYEESVGEGEGAVLHFLSIEEGEGLRCNGGSFTVFAGVIGAGLVKGFEERIAEAAEFFGVDATAVTLGGEGVGLVDGGGSAHDLEGLGGDLPVDVGLGREASDFGVHFAAGDEHGIAEFLGGEAAGEEGGVELVSGVGEGLALGIGVAGAALVGGGGDDEGVELFNGGAMLGEPVGEVVEEFGMGGECAGAAEVVRVSREAFAEVPGPDAVDNDASGEGVFWVDDPVGEGEAAVALGGGEFGGWHLAERFGGADCAGNDGGAE